MLHGKKIILGVCGSIAAYKAAHLVRLLIKAGAEVQVVMTPAAQEFITPLTLATLSKNPVLSEFTRGTEGEWNNHVELGLWADAILIAPASANTLAKMANGFCDNLLLATYLSAKCPVYVAPAMDLDMYAHPATSNNLKSLKSFGNHVIDAEYGELASGLVGNGRMAEPEHIIDVLNNQFAKKKTLEGKKFLITAGPTNEPLDPVRFIGNHSSGKMGYALALAVASRGAEVELVSGPTTLTISHPSVHVHAVTTAEQMHEKCLALYPESQVAILSAAVADYRPKQVAEQKIKKRGDVMQLELVKTVDIAKELGQMKKDGQINVGFALETESEKVNATTKLESKNFDFIVLNTLNDDGAGFGYDTNKISIIDRNNNSTDFELKSKQEVAEDIIDALLPLVHD